MKPYYQDKYEDVPPELLRNYIAQQTCWICGRGDWKALSGHLVKAHGLPAAQVREMAYMFKTERLISSDLSERMAASALARFGKRRHIPLTGQRQEGRELSTKQRDILKQRVERIRPLTLDTHDKFKHPHLCPICGTFIGTASPLYCSEKCVSAALAKSAREHMTPGAIAKFKAVLYQPTSEELSGWSKARWEKFRQLPIEEQRKINLEHAASRRVRIYKRCVICSKVFDVIPSHADKAVTCGNPKCKSENCRIKSTGRKHKPESIAKMSIHARERHISEPLFGRKV
jgi:hypothetical protein